LPSGEAWTEKQFYFPILKLRLEKFFFYILLEIQISSIDVSFSSLYYHQLKEANWHFQHSAWKRLSPNPQFISYVFYLPHHCRWHYQIFHHYMRLGAFSPIANVNFLIASSTFIKSLLTTLYASTHSPVSKPMPQILGLCNDSTPPLYFPQTKTQFLLLQGLYLVLLISDHSTNHTWGN
jgi:hypothetical protein